jgi:hypothetical protein
MQRTELTKIHPIAATNDLDAIRAWLANCANTRNTFDQ